VERPLIVLVPTDMLQRYRDRQFFQEEPSLMDQIGIGLHWSNVGMIKYCRETQAEVTTDSNAAVNNAKLLAHDREMFSYSQNTADLSPVRRVIAGSSRCLIYGNKSTFWIVECESWMT
jgi:hypothetical protein